MDWEWRATMPKAAQRIADLADKSVCSSQAPEGVKYRVAQAGYPALKFVVEPDGRRYWTVRYVAAGKNSERILGRWPQTLQPKALAEAVKLREVALTADPADVKRRERLERTAARGEAKARKANTFQALADKYLTASERGTFRGSGQDRPKAAGTLAKERQYLRKHVLPRLGSRPLADITRREIKGHLEEIAEQSGDSATNSCLEVIRRVFAYGRDKELIETNPSLEIARRKTPPRDVVASDEGLRTLWLALEEAKADRTFKNVGTKPSDGYATAAALQLSLLTLQRRGEIVRIRRGDVDLDKRLWVIPAMNKKERRKGLVPLSPWAADILTEAFERSGGDWAFPGVKDGRKRGQGAKGKEPEGHLMPKTVTRFMARVRERTGVGEITPHDLRRTGRTRLTGEELQIDEMTAERVLNHSVGSRQQNAYDWNAYLAPKRNALEAWAGELRRIVLREVAPSNVIAFNGGPSAG